jgi:transcriptional regulator with XRE-family HTH domain
MSSVASDVGRRIALLRHRLGLSQVAFAGQAGISRNALITYERGGGVPKSGALARIAEAGESLGSRVCALGARGRRFLAGAEAFTLRVEDLDFTRRELWVRRTWRSRKLVHKVLAE